LSNLLHSRLAILFKCMIQLGTYASNAEVGIEDVRGNLANNRSDFATEANLADALNRDPAQSSTTRTRSPRTRQLSGSTHACSPCRIPRVMRLTRQETILPASWETHLADQCATDSVCCVNSDLATGSVHHKRMEPEPDIKKGHSAQRDGLLIKG